MSICCTLSMLGADAIRSDSVQVLRLSILLLLFTWGRHCLYVYLLIPNKILALKKKTFRRLSNERTNVKSVYEPAYSMIASAGNEELLVVFQTFLWCHCQVMNDVVRTELLQAIANNEWNGSSTRENWINKRGFYSVQR